ncbi:MAG TPA: hypothetical protein VII16_10425 [Actinomycetes bacterium]|jgi:hypothetical protein
MGGWHFGSQRDLAAMARHRGDQRLFTPEWLHYGYALVMIMGLVLLRPGFVDRALEDWGTR